MTGLFVGLHPALGLAPDAGTQLAERTEQRMAGIAQYSSAFCKRQSSCVVQDPVYNAGPHGDYVISKQDKLTLHYLPGYAPDLNPDELVWSHAKRPGVARRPL
jgi:hypothetical protein